MKIYLRSFQNYNLIQTHENAYCHILLESPSPFPSPLGGCVRIVVFVAADFSLRNRDVEFQWLTSIWTATTSKDDYDTVSRGRGIRRPVREGKETFSHQ